MTKTLLKKSAILLILFTLVIGQAAVIQADTIEMIEIFFQEDLKDEYFTEQVLAQLSVEELAEIRADYTEDLGEFKEVEVASEDNHIYNVYFTEGTIEMQFVVNENNQIAGLYFVSVTEMSGDLQEIVSDFEELTGEVSLLLTKNGEELAAINPDSKLAVG